jgi:hypothetical protein
MNLNMIYHQLFIIYNENEDSIFSIILVLYLYII